MKKIFKKSLVFSIATSVFFFGSVVFAATDTGTATESSDAIVAPVTNSVTTSDVIPAGPMTNPATNITSTSATLHSTNNSSIDVVNTSFWWGTTAPAGPFSTPADFPASNWVHDNGLGGQVAGASFSNILTNLTPKTKYYFTSWVLYGVTWYADSGPVLDFTTPGLQQTITVTPAAPTSAMYGDTFPVAATTTSGLPIDISTIGGCSIFEGTITMTSETTDCTINFNQAGDSNYDATSTTEAVTITNKQNTSSAPVQPVRVDGPTAGGSIIGWSQGSVLGATTDTGNSCQALLSTYLKRGGQNGSEQVKKLQIFLNSQNLGSTLEVNGIFDLNTENVVKLFQEKYAKEILAPWGLTKGTGYVYKTTLRWINHLACPGSAVREISL